MSSGRVDVVIEDGCDESEQQGQDQHNIDICRQEWYKPLLDNVHTYMKLDVCCRKSASCVRVCTPAIKVHWRLVNVQLNGR
jgi:hypothetical protein